MDTKPQRPTKRLSLRIESRRGILCVIDAADGCEIENVAPRPVTAEMEYGQAFVTLTLWNGDYDFAAFTEEVPASPT